MPTRRACSAKNFRKYRAPVLSVLLHTLALAVILINLNAPEGRQQSSSHSAAITVIAAADMPALPPWPTIDLGYNQTPLGANSVFAELRGDAPLLQTNNAIALPDAAVQPPAAAPQPADALPQPVPAQIAYGHFDPAIFAAPEQPQRGQGNAVGAQNASSLSAAQSDASAGKPGDGSGLGEFLKGQFRVRIVTTRNNAYIVVEIIGGNGVMRNLLDKTAQHYQTYAQYDETSGGQNGRFMAPVLAGLP